MAFGLVCCPIINAGIIDIRGTHGRFCAINQRAGIDPIRTLEWARLGRITAVETAKAVVERRYRGNFKIVNYTIYHLQQELTGAQEQ